MIGSGGTTPVSDTAGVECSVTGTDPYQSQLVWEQGDVGGGRSGVHKREGLCDHRYDIPLVQSYSWVSLIGAVESHIRVDWGTYTGIVNSYTVNGWNICKENAEKSYLFKYIHVLTTPSQYIAYY